MKPYKWKRTRDGYRYGPVVIAHRVNGNPDRAGNWFVVDGFDVCSQYPSGMPSLAFAKRVVERSVEKGE